MSVDWKKLRAWKQAAKFSLLGMDGVKGLVISCHRGIAVALNANISEFEVNYSQTLVHLCERLLFSAHCLQNWLFLPKTEIFNPVSKICWLRVAGCAQLPIMLFIDIEITSPFITKEQIHAKTCKDFRHRRW